MAFASRLIAINRFPEIMCCHSISHNTQASILLFFERNRRRHSKGPRFWVGRRTDAHSHSEIQSFWHKKESGGRWMWFIQIYLHRCPDLVCRLHLGVACLCVGDGLHTSFQNRNHSTMPACPCSSKYDLYEAVAEHLLNQFRCCKQPSGLDSRRLQTPAADSKLFALFFFFFAIKICFPLIFFSSEFQRKKKS